MLSAPGVNCCCLMILRCILKQTACINVHGVPLIGDMLESLWLSHYKSTVSKVSKVL